MAKIPVVDPTKNVLQLVKAEGRRQDDLRKAEGRRQDDLRKMATRYGQQVARAEARRIDANAVSESRRLDNVNAAAASAVTIALKEASTQAATIAAQVVSSADALRIASEATKNEQNKRLTELEQNRYATGGRDVQRAAQLVEGRWETRSRSQGSQWAIGLAIFGGIAFVGLMISAVSAVLRLTGH